MRATVQFTRPNRKLSLLIRLLSAVKSIKDIRQQLRNDGILLERLAPGDIESVKKTLMGFGNVKHVVTDGSVRVLIDDDQLPVLFGLMLPIPRKHSGFARLFWERGFTLERLAAGQAEALRQRLEAVASVAVTPDIPRMQIHTISGLVRQEDGTPLHVSGFTVCAFDVHFPDSPVSCGAAAALQADGFYRIDYAWQSNGHGRTGPDLLVRVCDARGDVVAEATKTSAVLQEFIDITAAVLRIVHGTVRHATGFPLAGLTARAFDRDMRAEVLLGQAVTDEDGNYQITYDAGQLHPGKTSADLVIRVLESDTAAEGQEDGRGEELAMSDIVFNAAPQQTIDIEIGSKRFLASEHERYLAELAPLIKEALLHELIDEDLSFLHGKTGISLAHLDCLRMDAQLSFQHGLPDGAVYGLLRQGLPNALQPLCDEGPARLHEAFTASLDHHLIPAKLAVQFDHIIERVLSLGASSDALVFSKLDTLGLDQAPGGGSGSSMDRLDEPPDEPHELDIRLKKEA